MQGSTSAPQPYLARAVLAVLSMRTDARHVLDCRLPSDEACMGMSLFKKLAHDQRGLSTLEYTILFVIIVVGALTLWSKFGQPVP